MVLYSAINNITINVQSQPVRRRVYVQSHVLTYNPNEQRLALLYPTFQKHLGALLQCHGLRLVGIQVVERYQSPPPTCRLKSTHGPKCFFVRHYITLTVVSFLTVSTALIFEEKR
jgi:hypothetical protein